MSKKRKLIETIINLLEESDEAVTKKGVITYSSDDEEQPSTKKRRIRRSNCSSDSESPTNKENEVDILNIIGEPATKKNSFEINPKLADLWQSLISKGLEKNLKKDIVEKIPSIENCKLKAPKLNNEILATLSSSAKTRDEKLCEKQDQIGLVINILNKVLMDRIQNNDKVNIEKISDSIRLLCDLHNLESLTRRAVILPGLNKNMKEALEETQISDFLFGTELNVIIKKSKDLEKSSKDLRRTTTKPLNYWGPSTSATTQQYQPPGGQRGNYLNKIRSTQRKYNRQQVSQAPPPARTTVLAQQWQNYRAARGRRPAQSMRKPRE